MLVVLSSVKVCRFVCFFGYSELAWWLDVFRPGNEVGSFYNSAEPTRGWTDGRAVKIICTAW